MNKKRVLWIIFLSAFILLLCGLGTSYFWLTRIYLPEQLDAHENARLLLIWEKEDIFSPPDQNKMTEHQLALFLQVNESLSAELHKIKREFEENSWWIAFDIIRLQPEWAGKKYLALRRFELSPKEYDWIVKCVLEFWIYRWKEESIEHLREFGWEFEEYSQDTKKPANYELLLSYEDDLSRIFEILWPEKLPINTTKNSPFNSEPLLP